MLGLLLRLVLLVAAISAVPAPSSAGEARLYLTEDLQLKIADAFMAEDEYYRAVTEYKKFLVLFPDSEKADYALFRVGLAYYRGEEYEMATQTFATVGQKYPNSGYGASAAYFEGLSDWKLGRFDQADTAFEHVVTQHPASEEAPLALLAKALASFDAKDLPGCKRELERFLVNYPADPRAINVRATITIIDENKELPRKSPAVAGVLSALVPGSGYMYAGRYGDGVTAFVVNGLFIAGTVVSAQQEIYPVAGVVGGVGLPFYVGNIYGSANAATKWNLAARRDLRRRIADSLDYHD
jgi:TolA-binding protein/TM2 domain-containing membrane protein YozV